MAILEHRANHNLEPKDLLSESKLIIITFSLVAICISPLVIYNLNSTCVFY